MKQLIYFLSFIFILSISPITCFASSVNDDNEDDESIETVVTDEIILTREDPEPIGRRSAPCPIYVSINQTNGVSIKGIDSKEIISYQIYDAENIIIGTYINDKDFARDLFSLNEFVKIKIILLDRTLVGEIYL